MTSKEPNFNKKLNELVKEFNSLGLRVKATGDDFGLHDFFLVLNTRGLDSKLFDEIHPFIDKYNAHIGISPVRTNDCMCIRIDDSQFNLKD